MSLTKPSLSELPMNDVAGDLIENHDFITQQMTDKKIKETADTLADNYMDRKDTVFNAVNLDDHPASYYLTKENGEKILGVTNTMSDIYSSEIRNLRNELYQLASHLYKNGYIKEELPFEGFIDAFRNSNKKYTGYICGIDRDSISRTESLILNDATKYNDFVPGEKFAIHKKDEEIDQYQFETVVNCDGNGRLDFDKQTILLSDKDKVELTKTCGMYIRNSFSFCKVEEGANPSSRERYHMQSDDTSTRQLLINKPNSGYAASFKVPRTSVINENACVLRFETIGSSVGTPGDLICYILDEEAIYDNDGNFKPCFTSMEDAKDKGLIIAQSKPVSYDEALRNESTISFSFYDKDRHTDYPIIKEKRYLFIIECVNADEENYWKLLFSYYKEAADDVQDLERYNKSFIYNKIFVPEIDNSTSLSEIDDINKFDLLFTLVTKDIIERKEIGFTEGLYTAEILLPKPIDVTRARLSMRINREGCWYIKSYDDSYTQFWLAKEDEKAHSATDLNFLEGDKVVIGNQIATIINCTSNKITIKEPVYIDERMNRLFTKYNDEVKIPVYRMNYDAVIKPYYIDWNDWIDEDKKYKTTEITENFLDMNLDAIIPAGNNILGSRISDKLIFQTPFANDENGIPKLANKFEIQIKWKSNYDANSLNDDDNYHDGFNELIGRIYELILTFDKNY